MTPEEQYEKIIVSNFAILFIEERHNFVDSDSLNALIRMFSFCFGKTKKDLLFKYLKESIISFSGMSKPSTINLLDYCIENPQYISILYDTFKDEFKSLSTEKYPTCYYTREISELKSKLGLTDVQAKICVLYTLVNSNKDLSDIVENSLGNSFLFDESIYAKEHLAKIFRCNVSLMDDAINDLFEMGFLFYEEHRCFGYELNQNIQLCLSKNSSKKISDLYKTIYPKNEIDLKDFKVDEKAKTFLLKLLSDDTPSSVFFYGNTGLGKTSFALTLAKKLNCKVLSVNSELNSTVSMRRISLSICARLASRTKNTLILVDEADALLDTDFASNGINNTSSKSWLNKFIETSKAKIIWIANDASYIDNAVKRRFNFSLFFKDLGLTERERLFKQILTKNKVHISPEQFQNIIRMYSVSAGVFENSVLTAKRYYRAYDDVYSCLCLQLDSYLSLEKNGLTEKELLRIKHPKTSNPEYNQHGINASMNITEIIESFKHADMYLKDNTVKHDGVGTVLFYGPPGTGKTELAKYIASVLNYKTVFKKASNLLGMYVGETEKNIAEAFNTGEQENTLLIIDEADSFIFPRESANRSWEITQVNEFLTQLEQFKGLVICTTNHQKGLDNAAIRRFKLKIEFKYLKPEQNLEMYKMFLDPVTSKIITDKEKEAISKLKFLTPSDFITVRDKHVGIFANKTKATHESLIKELQNEIKLKNDPNIKQSIGF